MNNKKYEDIKLPKNIDEIIKIGVKKAIEEEKQNEKLNFKIASKIAAASLVGVITLGVASPAIASKIPVVGNVFEAIEKNLYFPSNYSQYANSINEVAYSNGIGITMSEAVCDGQSLYITYIVENDEPFKYTSWENGQKLDMDQLLVEESHNDLSFTKEEPDTSGFTGLEGKFIDEKTFVGIKKYDLSFVKEEIPSEFTFKTKFEAIENYAIKDSDKSYIKHGTWAFNVPIKVNKDLKREIIFENIENDFVKINSLTLTPFKTVLDMNFKQRKLNDYEITAFDENNKVLKWDKMQEKEGDSENVFVFLENLGESKSIRIVVEKPILEEKENEKGVYKEVGREAVFDQVIPIN